MEKRKVNYLEYDGLTNSYGRGGVSGGHNRTSNIHNRTVHTHNRSLDMNHRADYTKRQSEMYNRTANAYDYAAQPAQNPHEEERRVIKTKRVIKRKKAVVYKKLIDKNIKINKVFVIYGIMFFLGAMSLITTNAMYEKKKNSVEALRIEIKALKESNQDMRIKLAAGYDENEIAQAAAMLGMSKPKPYQIIEIYVPKESYAKGLGTEAQTEDTVSLLDKIIRFLFNE